MLRTHRNAHSLSKTPGNLIIVLNRQHAIKGCHKIPRRFSKKHLEANSITTQYKPMDLAHGAHCLLKSVRSPTLPQARGARGGPRGTKNAGRPEMRKLWLPLLPTSGSSLAEFRVTADSARDTGSSHVSGVVISALRRGNWWRESRFGCSRFHIYIYRMLPQSSF